MTLFSKTIPIYPGDDEVLVDALGQYIAFCEERIAAGELQFEAKRVTAQSLTHRLADEEFEADST